MKKNLKKDLTISALVIILTMTASYFTISQAITKSQDRYLHLAKQLGELQIQGAGIQAAYAEKIPSTISSGAPGFCYTFEENVSDENIASDKDKVKKIHEILEREGIEISGEEKNSMTLGETSRTAISLFQEKYTKEILSPSKLKEPNGILDRLTIKKMNGLYGCQAKEAQAKEKRSKNRIIVKFKQSATEGKIKEIIAKHKTPISPDDKRSAQEKKRFLIVKTPEEKSAEDIVEDYKKEPDVEYAELDYKVQVSSPAIVNDPYALMQLSFYRMGVLSNEGTGAFNLASNFNQNVKVAILDSGIDSSHPDLQGRVIANKNFSSSGTTLPVCTHGNYMAGIVAATTNNTLGVTGLGHNVLLMNVKVIGDDCWVWFSDAASGVYWAVDNGADVINMSFGSPTDTSSSLSMAINYAQQQGVVVVGAAGNDSLSKSMFPASVPVVISVGATDLNDAKMSFSNYGNGVDVAAPAAQVYTTSKTGYGLSGGTSAASAEVSGLAALILATGQCSLKAEGCVRNKIESTADKISGTGSYWQYGRINAFKALGGNNYKEPIFKPLVAKKSGTGGGIVRTITPPKSAINCGSKCSAKFALNSDITIKAIVDTGSKFVKWTSDGPCNNSTATTCAFTFNPAGSNQVIKAVFELIKPLVIQKSGTGSGTVKSTSPTTAINCGSTCSADFAVNTKITLSATPAAGSKFVKWTSDVPCNNSTATTCAFTFNPVGINQTITAVFDKI